jgi:hypothetical protein
MKHLLMPRALQTKFFRKELLPLYSRTCGTPGLPIGQGALRLCPAPWVFVFNTGVKLVFKEIA